MAKFTILRPPSGHVLHIPTVAGLIINLTFTLENEQYLLDGYNLKIILPDNTILIFDKLLSAAQENQSAPLIVQPESETINTHELLLALGVDSQELEQAGQQTQATSNTMLSSNQVNELLASSLYMDNSWREDFKEESLASWSQSSYILPTPSNKLPVRYHVQLAHMPGEVTAGELLSLGLDFVDLQNQQEPLSSLQQPLLLYLVFTPGAENYSISNFIDFAGLTVTGREIISKDWESNPQGACLLKLAISAGNILPDENNLSRLWVHLPVYETYMKGASCSITLAAAIGHKMREGSFLGGQVAIKPNFIARVIYSAPQSAEAFSFDRRSVDIDPPNLAIRALNFEQGDVVLITQMLQELGPQAQYQLKPQGGSIMLRIWSDESNYRILLENINIEDMLCNSSFVAIDDAPPEWLSYNYITEAYVQKNAVAEADTVLTVKTLLNAFLNEEDYLSMQTVLDNLGRHED